MASVFLTPLSRRVLHERWKGLIGWIVGVMSLVAIQVSVYPTIRNSRKGWSDVTEQFPEAFRKIFRMEDYTSPTGYLTTELFSFMIPLIFIGLTSTWAARAMSEEEENGTADILLTLPITRSSIGFTRVLTTIAVVGFLIAVTSASLIVGTEIVVMDVGLMRIVEASTACGLLSLPFGGIAALLASLTGRRGVGLGGGLGVAIAAFVLYSLAPLVSFLEHLLPVNPFEWTIGQTPLANGLDPWLAMVTLVVAGVLFAGAFIGYDRRDISS